MLLAPERPIPVTALRGPHAMSSGLVSNRLQGAIRSPSFTIERNNILYHVAGKGARAVQDKRFAGQTSNARMDTKHLKQHCDLSDSCLLLMKQAMDELGLSARAYDRILKVARTIADLAGSEKLTSDHISEAIQYRSLDRQLWA